MNESEGMWGISRRNLIWSGKGGLVFRKRAGEMLEKGRGFASPMLTFSECQRKCILKDTFIISCSEMEKDQV